MNLQEHYHQLYTKSAKSILAGHYTLDPQLKNEDDSRFGITLLLRPSKKIKTNIQLFLEELKTVDPVQYYYCETDIHITLMSIISCYKGFTLDKINVQDYIEIIQKSLEDLGEIKIDCKGVTASDSAIMIQGFPTDETLNDLRDKLRERFKKSTLEQSIDSRYAISTAHSTVVRFQEKLQNPTAFMQVIEKFRTYDFGSFSVENIELVYNDWYQRKSKTIHLSDFPTRKRS
jgi:2'-5' RNA ligase